MLSLLLYRFFFPFRFLFRFRFLFLFLFPFLFRIPVFPDALATEVSPKHWIASVTSKGSYKNGRRWRRLSEQSQLNDGYKMPLFGLGVFKALSDDRKGVVKFALQNGYRMIDTAALYA